MRLIWDLSNIKNYESVCWVDGDEGDIRLNPVTETLIYATLSVGLGSITEKNLDEFVGRFRVMERLQGPFMRNGDGSDSRLTDDELAAHVGLVTNVSNETRAAWARRIFVNKQTSETERFARSFRRRATVNG
jgi:hypothetical protein